MQQRMTTMERASDLARFGRFTNLTEVIKTLDREGYSASQIQGPLLKRQLTDLIKAARRDPVLNGTSIAAPS
jgi:hypothetical protein